MLETVNSIDASPATPRDRAATLLMLGVVLLIPLFPPESHGLGAAAAAALVAALGLCLFPKLESGVASGGLLLTIVLVLFWAAVGQAPGDAIESVSQAYLGVAAGLCCAALPAQVRRDRRIPAVLALGVALMSLHAIYQVTGGLQAQVDALAGSDLPQAMRERLEEGRAFARFATPAALGGFLILALPVVAGWARAESGAVRWALAALTVLGVVALASTRSATAVAAIALSLVLLALRTGKARRAILVGVLIALALLTAVVGLRGEQLWNPEAKGSPWALRAGNFRIAAEMIADHPLSGVGPGAFGEAYPQYRQPGDNATQHAHNLPLELTAETGLIVGGLLSACFFLAFLGPLLRRAPSREPHWHDGIPLGLCAFALHNLADFTAFFASMFWLAAMLRGVYGAQRAGATSGAPSIPKVTLAGTLVAAMLFALAGLGAEARWRARLAFTAGDEQAARGYLEQATRFAPWNPDGWLQRAQLEEQWGDGGANEATAGALDHVERAIRLCPSRPAAFAQRARLRFEVGDHAGAFADLRRSAELYPNQGDYATERDRLEQALRSALPGEEPR